MQKQRTVFREEARRTSTQRNHWNYHKGITGTSTHSTSVLTQQKEHQETTETEQMGRNREKGQKSQKDREYTCPAARQDGAEVTDLIPETETNEQHGRQLKKRKVDPSRRYKRVQTSEGSKTVDITEPKADAPKYPGQMQHWYPRSEPMVGWELIGGVYRYRTEVGTPCEVDTGFREKTRETGEKWELGEPT